VKQGTRSGTYDRMARWYDAMQAPMDWLGGNRRRQRVVQQARGRVLEVGIGTGLNFEFYADTVQLIGLDPSRRMLERAAARLAQKGREAALVQGDVERLPFPDSSFDTIVATCVFCSVNDPVRGLREVLRVLRPTGRVLLLEHVRPRNPILGKIADLVSPITRRLMGPEVNRRTEENVACSGLVLLDVRREGVWREMNAGKTSHPPL
jgi:ubiquinone/menaquinone biosynthesis C-methylase UbiE